MNPESQLAVRAPAWRGSITRILATRGRCAPDKP